MITTFDFSHALVELKDGYKVKRKDWSSAYLQAEYVEEDMQPLIHKKNICGTPVAWPCCQADIAADDWVCVE